VCLKIPKITKFLWNLLLKESILVQIPVESAYILYRIVSIIVAIVYYHHREPLSWFIFIAHADNSALSIDWLVEYECIINKYNYLYFVYLTYTSKPTVVFLWTHICLLDLVHILSYFFSILVAETFLFESWINHVIVVTIRYTQTLLYILDIILFIIWH